MAEQVQQQQPAGQHQDQGPGGEDDGVPGVGWVDWAGGAAAVLLVLIVADIFTDGRLLSAPLRRLFARRNQEEGGGGGVPPAGPGGN